MRVLMVAPPGAGKGTQGTVIATHFGIPHIATGDLLLQMAVFAALISYIMMMASHLKLRRDLPQLERPPLREVVAVELHEVGEGAAVLGGDGLEPHALGARGRERGRHRRRRVPGAPGREAFAQP